MAEKHLLNFPNIINPTAEAVEFLRQWIAETPTIVAHTSGSTGKPKEINLNKTDMILSAESTCRFFGITPNSVLHCPLSANYIAGKMMIVRALVSGAKLSFEQPSNVPLATMPSKRINLLPLVPSQLDSFIRNPNRKMVTNVIVGGAPLSAERELMFKNAPFCGYATYGMTETCSHVALRPLGVDETLFTALPGFSFETDSDGCLRIISERMSFGSLQTNDIVELVDSRRFRWVGRRDNVVISGGLKAFPEEIERKISHLFSCPIAVVGVDDEKWGQRTIVLVETNEAIDSTDLITRMKSLLAAHEMPREIRAVNQLLRTDSGKIIRRIP